MHRRDRAVTRAVLRFALLQEVVSAAVVHDDRREAFDLEAPNRFGAEILECDDGRRLDVAIQECARAANRDAVDRVVPLDGVAHDRAAAALADDSLEPELSMRGVYGSSRIDVVGPAEPMTTPSRGRRRADVVDDLAAQIDWQLFAAVRHLDQPLVGSVAGGVDDAGE